MQCSNGQLRGYECCSCFICRKSCVQTAVRQPAILREVFTLYLSNPKQIRSSASNKGQSPPSTSFQFQFSSVILPIDGTGVDKYIINPLNPELNPMCYLLTLLGAHHFLHVSRKRVTLVTIRRLMSYIYGATILDVSRSHTTTQHSR